jgi:hypothetical protein
MTNPQGILKALFILRERGKPRARWQLGENND